MEKNEIEKAIQDAMTKKKDLRCTCDEYSKQRAICPVCDPEKYAEGQEFIKQAIADASQSALSIEQAAERYINDNPPPKYHFLYPELI